MEHPMSAHRTTTAAKFVATSTAKKAVLTLALAGTAAGIAGMGTFGAFTSTTSASRTDASGTVIVGLGAKDASTNRLSVGASGLVPGDTIQRTVDLKNTGTQDFGSVTMTTNATTSSLLDVDSVNGLQMVVDKCSVPWTEGGTSPAYTYTCSGTTSTVVASRPVIGFAMPMSNLVLTAGSTNSLRVTLTLPASAGNVQQGQSSSFNFQFDATQRTATAH
jgi:hypothetical protein